MVDFRAVEREFRPGYALADRAEQAQLCAKVQNFPQVETARLIIRPLQLGLPPHAVALNWLCYWVDRLYGHAQKAVFKTDYPKRQLNPLVGQDAPDVAGLHSVLGDPEVSKWIYFYRQPFTRQQALWWINRSAVESRQGTFQMLGVFDKASGEMVGEIHIDFDLARRAIDIGYSCRKDQQGKGITSEAAQAAIEACFKLGFENLIVTAGESNAASRRIIEGKLGLAVRKFYDIQRADGTMRPSVAYFDTAEGWRARRADTGRLTAQPAFV